MKHILLLTAGLALYASQPIVAQESVSNSAVTSYVGSDQTDWPILDENLTGVEDVSALITKGWSFKDYATGDGIIIKTGGSFTTPPLEGLAGTCKIYLDIETWLGEDVKEEEIDYSKNHVFSVNKGILNITEYNELVSMMETPAIYDGTSETRLTFTAAHDVRLKFITIQYYSLSLKGKPCAYSHDSGDFTEPLDLVISPAKLDGYDSTEGFKVVYTLDGSTPTASSALYEKPIHIETTTTVKAATISPNGNVYLDDEYKTYTLSVDKEYQKPEATYEVTLSSAGKLKTQLLDLNADNLEGVVIKGKINGDDLKFLSSGTGYMANLKYVDMSGVELVYDDTHYRTVVDAPEGGMGTTYTYHYFLSETNRQEKVSGSPTSETHNCYSNNLALLFFNHPKIECVALPRGMTSLGKGALASCENLTKVVLPETITELENMALASPIEMYKFPTQLKKIGMGALTGTKLGKVVLADDVEIGEEAFSGSTISSFEMQNAPDTIPDGLFSRCENLKKVIIGGNVKYIGSKTFAYCPIEEMSLPASIREIAGDAFDEYNKFVNSIQPEDGIRYIGKVAYRLADRTLTEYTVKEGTVSIADELFKFTPATKFNLPSSLEIIGKESFWNTQITSTPDLTGVKRIGNQAFAYCQNLARAVIPESVEYLYDPFAYCDNLWDLTYNAIDAEIAYGYLKLSNIERITIGNKVRRIPGGLYTEKTNITEVTLPESVEIIGENAFNQCTNLKSVYLPDNITTIEDGSFSYCYSLSDIHWPLNLKTIGGDAFRDCSSLKVVSLPEGMTTLGDDAFLGCDNVEKIYIASTIVGEEIDAFTFYNSLDQPITITAPSKTPQDIRWNWHYMRVPLIKVPAESIELYKANQYWSGAINSRENEIVSIEGIAAPKEESSTSFATEITDDTDLTDTTIGDVYVTLGENDSYDATDGSIVIGSTMTDEEAEAVAGMAPGTTDVANRFNGLIAMVPSGNGEVTVNCMTLGNVRLSVKVGDSDPQSYEATAKGDITVNYDVNEDTYVYVYGSNADQQAAPRRSATRAADNANCIKIYSLTVTPKQLGNGIADITGDNGSEIDGWYDVAGRKIAQPTTPGIYVVRFTNGESKKVIIR